MKKLLILVISLIAIFSCSKDKNNSDSVRYAFVGGIVTDSQTNMPIEDVEISVVGYTTKTNSNGVYTFDRIPVPKGRIDVKFYKDGYFELHRSDENSANLAQLDVMLINFNNGTSQSFMSSTGGVVNLTNGSKLTFPANIYIDKAGTTYSGLVTVKAVFLDPTEANYANCITGGDMACTDTVGQKRIAKSYGGMNIELYGTSNEKLNIKPLTQSQYVSVEFAIPSTLIAEAPSSIEIMYYNVANGLYTSSRSGTKNGGKVLGSVDHFTYWGCKKVYTNIGTISGRVISSTGLPVAGIEVEVGNTKVRTNHNGIFSQRVPISEAISVKIEDGFNVTANQSPFTLITNNEVKNIGDITLSGQYYSGRIIDCNNSLIPGRVVLSYFSQNYSCYTTNGYFNIFVPSSFTATNGEVTANGETQYLTSINQNLGDIVFCTPATPNESYIILNGDVFESSKVNFEITRKIQSYSDSIITTSLNLQGNDSLGMVSANISFKGEQTGLFYMGAKSSSHNYVSISIANTYYYMTSGSIRVNRYDREYGLIEGEISGILTESTSGQTGENPAPKSLTVSGKFSVVNLIRP